MEDLCFTASPSVDEPEGGVSSENSKNNGREPLSVDGYQLSSVSTEHPCDREPQVKAVCSDNSVSEITSHLETSSNHRQTNQRQCNKPHPHGEDTVSPGSKGNQVHPQNGLSNIPSSDKIAHIQGDKTTDSQISSGEDEDILFDVLHAQNQETRSYSPPDNIGETSHVTQAANDIPEAEYPPGRTEGCGYMGTVCPNGTGTSVSKDNYTVANEREGSSAGTAASEGEGCGVSSLADREQGSDVSRAGGGLMVDSNDVGGSGDDGVHEAGGGDAVGSNGMEGGSEGGEGGDGLKCEGGVHVCDDTGAGECRVSGGEVEGSGAIDVSESPAEIFK